MKQENIIKQKIAERILSELKFRGVEKKVYECEAIVESILPRDEKLRIDALYILGLMLGEEFNPNMEEYEKDTQFINAGFIAGLIVWCQNNHFIKNPKYMQAILGYFDTNGITEEELSEEAYESYKKGVELVQSVDPYYTINKFGLGQLACDIVSHWNELYREELAYDIIFMCVFEEHIICEFNTIDSVALAKKMEEQYIAENMK